MKKQLKKTPKKQKIDISINSKKIELVPTDSLSEYEFNAKEHPDHQVQEIVNSIKEFGFNDPIAIDEEGVIIEGHGRLLAALKLGMKKVPIVRLEHLTDTQKRAYILAHNQLTLNTGFDFDIMEKELMDISKENLDMSLFGFDTSLLEGYEDSSDVDPNAPTSFSKVEVTTTHTCPKCGYQFNG